MSGCPAVVLSDLEPAESTQARANRSGYDFHRLNSNMTLVSNETERYQSQIVLEPQFSNPDPAEVKK